MSWPTALCVVLDVALAYFYFSQVVYYMEHEDDLDPYHEEGQGEHSGVDIRLPVTRGGGVMPSGGEGG